MRCLHCGSTLSAFKKFTDGDFCSAEHRDAFYSEQQRLILARLKDSADRFNRFRRPNGTGDSIRTPAPPLVVPVQAEPPVPFAEFLLPKPEPGDRPVRLGSIPSIDFLQDPGSKPRFVTVSSGGEHRFCALVPDFPWPRYNPGLLWLAELLFDEANALQYLPGLQRLSFDKAFSFSAAGLLAPQWPSVATRVSDPPPRTVLRMAKPQARLSFGPACLLPTHAPLKIGGYGFQPYDESEPIAPSELIPVFQVQPISLAENTGLTASLRLRSAFQSKGMSFLDRIYRMRPRFGVSSDDVPLMRTVPAEPLSAQATAVHPVAAGSSKSWFEPAQVRRFVRLSPRVTSAVTAASQLRCDTFPLPATGTAPAISYMRPSAQTRVEFQHGPLQAHTLHAALTGETLPPMMGVDSGEPLSSATPAYPVSESTWSAQPAQLDRLFLPRPRGPVDAELQGASAERTQFAVPVVSPSKPVSGTLLDGACEPAIGTRFFRQRPHGPVITQVADFDALSAEPSDWTSEAAIGSLPKPTFALDLPATETLFRTRPRSGVVSASHADLTTASATEGLLSPPVTPALQGSCSAAPTPISRMFRMRPRAGVDSADATTFHASNPEAYGSQVPQPANPVSVAPPLTAAIGVLDRLYSSQPIDPAASAALEFSEVEAGDPAATAPSSPVSPSLVATAAVLSPRSTDSMLRTRPSGGVLDGTLAASLEPSAQVEKLLSAPAKPAIRFATCEPVQVDRMFRMRPRSGVGQHTGLLRQIPAGAESSAASPAIAQWDSRSSNDLSPRPLDRLYRGRPRAGVPSEASATFATIAVDAASFETKPMAVCQGLPDCAPPVAAKLFRFRPKAGVDASMPLALFPAEFVVFPAVSPKFMPDWWDVLHGAKPMFVNKMYRMRLKQPAQDPETVTHAIRTRHLPPPEAEPVLATLPAPESSAAPSFLDRLYRMRPKGGKSATPAANPIPCDAIEPKLVSGAPASALLSISKHWKAAPLRVKSLAATVPILLLIALFPWGKATTAAENPFRDAMSRRAAIERTANFVDQLAQWPGAERWKLTPSGAIEPSGLALFQPSLKMRNYRMSFFTQVHKGGVGFVVRATDDRNYQAIKLKVVKQGPLPVVRIARWAVIDGVQTNYREIPLPVNVIAETQYRVALDVNDQSFTLMVQDKVVDFWSEEQLKSGGAGFFSDKGERASIHGVRMTHQDDAIGKLFAALTLREPSSN